MAFLEKGQFPQVIGHRGLRGAHPENSMAAFRSAIDVGAHAIETDLHLSKDGVVVLSHDATLRRCFGDPRKVADCDWSELSMLRTLSEPQQHMCRLVELLEYVTQPELGHVWLLLDIKRDDAADELLKRLSAAFAHVPSPSRPWEQRVILAIWDAPWLAACTQYLPGFPLALTTPSPVYASAMLPIPGLHMSLLNYSFSTRRGANFRDEATSLGRKVFSWTDTAPEWMALSVENKVDGVITDDPEGFIRLCAQWKDEEKRRKARKWTMWEAVFWLGINANVWITETMSHLTSNSL
ncbi:glycerophosphoryl diester phosphodiesterase [Apiospora kogelbergensis]|uniref:glycerophosphoryl diester phosphodiesterase n=1 Tax=Apiospora kogelbergensis TaxID=1337665 RepID=UPI00312F59B8